MTVYKKPKTFELTEDHVKLIQRMFIEYDEYTETGAPIVDPKRPYGNSDVAGDVAEILEWTLNEDGYDDGLSLEMEEAAMKLHRETEQALQVFVRCAQIDPGTYTTQGPFDQDWSKQK